MLLNRYWGNDTITPYQWSNPEDYGLQFAWIRQEWSFNQNKTKYYKTECIYYGIFCLSFISGSIVYLVLTFYLSQHWRIKVSIRISMQSSFIKKN